MAASWIFRESYIDAEGVELTQAVPFQYCPLGQDVLVDEVVEFTHEEPLQYWPDGQLVELPDDTQLDPFQY